MSKILISSLAVYLFLTGGAVFAASAPHLMPPDDAPDVHDARGPSLQSRGSNAQLSGLDALPGTWISQGPGAASNGQVENVSPADEVVGAVHTVLAHPVDPDTLYAGTVNGGVWITTNATDASPVWTALTDDQPSLSIGAMEYDRSDPTHQTVVVGFGRYSSFSRTGGPLAPGLIRSTDGGANWTAIDDALLDGEACSGIYAHGPVMLFGANATDGNGGLYRSANSGVDWTTIDGAGGSGLPNDDVYDLVSDPNQTNRLYLTLDDTGIFRSDDQGLTWTDISDSRITSVFGGANQNNAELAVSPVSGRVYLAVINSGQAEYIGYTDSPGGVTPVWTEMDIPCIPSTSGTSATVTGATDASPIEITATAHPFTSGEWVAIDNVLGNTAANGVFRIDDTGANTFTLRHSSGNGTYAGGGSAALVDGLNPRDKPGGQGGIHFSIVAHPTDANAIFVGGDRQDAPFANFIGAANYSGSLWRGDTTVGRGMVCPSPQWQHLTHSDSVAAIPGGGTASTSSPHADSREMVFDANGDIIEGDDGGIYRRTSPLNNSGDWVSVIGDLRCSEQHDIAYDTVSDIIFSGNQDTGTTFQKAPGSIAWESALTADGGDVAVSPHPSNPVQSVRYSSFQNLGAFSRGVFNAAGGLVSGGTPTLTVTSGVTLVPQFVTPLAVNRVDPSRIMIGGANSPYESFDQCDNLVELNQGAGLSANGNSAGRSIVYGGRRLGVDNPDVVYLADGAGIWVRTAGVGDLINATAYPGGSVRGLVMDPEDWMTLYVVDSDQVFATANAGGSWTDITGDLSGADLRSVECIRDGARTAVVVGTGSGVYGARSDDLTDWFKIGDGMPNVLVYDMTYDATDDLLVVGTLGRGAWSFADATEIVTDPGLSFTFSVAPSQAAAGDTLTYSVNIHNEATTSVTDVAASSTVPDDATYVPASVSHAGSVIADSVTWPLFGLAAGASTTRTFQVTVDAAATGWILYTDDHENGADGWVVSNAVGGVDWALSTANPYSGTSSWFALNTDYLSDQYLSMATPVALDGACTLSFRHAYNTEENWDGGLVDYSVDGGAWVDLGSLMTQEPYNSAVFGDYGGPAGDTAAFTGDSGGYVETRADLSSLAGSDLRLRFRMSCDSSLSEVGWYVDDVQIFQDKELTNSACVSATGWPEVCRASSLSLLPVQPFLLDTEVMGSGVVDVADQLLSSGVVAVVTATADPYYYHDRWSGDTNGAAVSSNQISVVMDQPRQLVAHFAENLVTNGMPQWWLAQYGWTNDFMTAATNDSDNDGMLAWEEWVADTIPTNKESLLALTGSTVTNGGVLVEWTGGESATQYLDYADDLLIMPDPWHALLTNAPPTATVTTYQHNGSITTSRFYRLRARRPL
ncbi:MAG: DUF11 domain-containing protein [Verrucomicrobia bacterium]|jgi:uncharacterized repeat protein (TIGR01451 family)|nr:DUF11 domain-containing protein [Verrucomicrobiota bacterium]MBT7065577.1 DUF11 domain-containing protein [Verrucomicrobiota bacterium]MBT7701051.1 DUF11 domain-containing protein [Verrucomicrobiota bacterium]